MLSKEQYIRLSLELNLFFLRIVKEHNVFAAASLPPKSAPVSMKLVSMNKNLDRLLSMTISLAQGNISQEVMTSGELITPRTLPAEKAVQFLTGIPIDTSITVREMNLGFRGYYDYRLDMVASVNTISNLNKEILKAVTEGINFQKNMLSQVLSCKAFSYTYPLNLEHVIHEASAYVDILKRLESKQGEDTTVKGLIEQEMFWNHIMEEHSEFIRGYLDPSEKALFKTANDFAEEFEALENATKALVSNPGNIEEVTKDSYNLVKELRNFKVQGTEGLLACKIKAIMPALLADHVTREANHYLRLLSAAEI